MCCVAYSGLDAVRAPQVREYDSEQRNQSIHLGPGKDNKPGEIEINRHPLGDLSYVQCVQNKLERHKVAPGFLGTTNKLLCQGDLDIF